MDWCQISAGAQTITKTNDKRTLSQSSVKLKLKELFFFLTRTILVRFSEKKVKHIYVMEAKLFS